MKKLLFAVMAGLMLTLVGCGSSKETAASFSSQKIIEVPNKPQAELFDKANAAAVQMFNKAGSVLTTVDKETGVIQGQYNASIVRSGPYYHKVNVLVTIEVRDAKVRLTMSDLTATYTADAIYGKYNQEGKSLAIDAKSGLEETFGAGFSIDAELQYFADTFIAKLGSSEW